jgi:hypothetical protein
MANCHRESSIMVLSSMAIFPRLETRNGREGVRAPGACSAIAEIAVVRIGLARRLNGD